MEADEIFKSSASTRGDDGVYITETMECEGSHQQAANPHNTSLFGQFHSGLAQTMSLVESMDDESRLKAIETLQAFISSSPSVTPKPASTPSSQSTPVVTPKPTSTPGCQRTPKDTQKSSSVSEETPKRTRNTLSTGLRSPVIKLQRLPTRSNSSVNQSRSSATAEENQNPASKHSGATPTSTRRNKHAKRNKTESVSKTEKLTKTPSNAAHGTPRVSTRSTARSQVTPTGHCDASPKLNQQSPVLKNAVEIKPSPELLKSLPANIKGVKVFRIPATLSTMKQGAGDSLASTTVVAKDFSSVVATKASTKDTPEPKKVAVKMPTMDECITMKRKSSKRNDTATRAETVCVMTEDGAELRVTVKQEITTREEHTSSTLCQVPLIEAYALKQEVCDDDDIILDVTYDDVTPETSHDVTQVAQDSDHDVTEGAQDSYHDVTEGAQDSDHDVTEGAQVSDHDVTEGAQDSDHDVTEGAQDSDHDVTEGVQESDYDVTEGAHDGDDLSSSADDVQHLSDGSDAEYDPSEYNSTTRNKRRRRRSQLKDPVVKARTEYKPAKAVLDFLRRSRKTQCDVSPSNDSDFSPANDSDVSLSGSDDVINVKRRRKRERVVAENDEDVDPEQPDVTEKTRICRRGRWIVLTTDANKSGWLCKTCNELFQFRATALAHLRIHTGERPFSCRFCPMAFSLQANMFRHCKDVHGRDPLQCVYCDAEFDNRRTMKKHILDEHQINYEKQISCEHCEATFFNRVSYKAHMRTSHPAHSDKFACKYCSKVFNHQPNLARHVKMHTGDKPHHCHLCDAAFIERRGLRIHIIKQHSDNPHATAIYDLVQKYACTTCGKEFLTKANLATHERTHTDDKPFACSYCSKRFNVKSNVVRHERIHRGEKRFQCPDCGKLFTEKRSMLVHRRLHTGEKPYECEICGKRFSQLGSLNSHTPVHTKQRNHKCDECSATFLRRAHLTIHMKKHSVPRHLPCLQCDRMFYTKNELLRHMATHAPKSYQCEVCERTFTRLAQINQHMLTHSKDTIDPQLFTSGNQGNVKMELSELTAENENELAAQGIMSLATGSSLNNIPVTMETNDNSMSLIMEANQSISDTLVEDIQRALAQEGASGEWQVVGVPQGNGLHEFRLERIAADHSEVERIAADHSEVERIAADHSEVERIAADHSEVERIAADHSQVERIAADHSEVKLEVHNEAQSEPQVAVLM